MKLKKFTKNQKQKGIIIGSIMGILLLIGGVTLYKTFALYKEEQSFDVLQGTVPYFVYGDIKLVIKVNEQQQTNIPDKKEEYVVEPKCDNDATIEWDYENWGPIIKNIKQETRCSLNFVTKNNLQTLGKLAGIENLNSIETLLTNGNIEKLVNRKSGMTYLAKSATLVEQLKSSNNYNETIRKQILNSDIISEDLKYEAGLPCYLIKNGQVQNNTGGIRARGLYNGKIHSENELRENFTIFNPSSQLTLVIGDALSIGIINTENKIKVNNYNHLGLTYKTSSNDNSNLLSGHLLVLLNKNDIYARTYEGKLNENNITLIDKDNLKKMDNFITEEVQLNEKDDSHIIIDMTHNDESLGNGFYFYISNLSLF